MSSTSSTTWAELTESIEETAASTKSTEYTMNTGTTGNISNTETTENDDKDSSFSLDSFEIVVIVLCVIFVLFGIGFCVIMKFERIKNQKEIKTMQENMVSLTTEKTNKGGTKRRNGHNTTDDEREPTMTSLADDPFTINNSKHKQMLNELEGHEESVGLQSRTVDIDDFDNPKPPTILKKRSSAKWNTWLEKS